MFYLDILHKGADAMEETHCELPKLISLYLYFPDVAQDFLSSLTQVTACLLASLFCLSGHSTPSQWHWLITSSISQGMLKSFHPTLKKKS